MHRASCIVHRLKVVSEGYGEDVAAQIALKVNCTRFHFSDSPRTAETHIVFLIFHAGAEIPLQINVLEAVCTEKRCAEGSLLLAGHSHGILMVTRHK